MFIAKSVKSSPVLVQEHVIKHGSHDQSTHNPKKGGGGASAGTAQNSGTTTLDSTHTKELASQERALRGIASGSKVGPRGQTARASDDEYLKEPIKGTVRAADHIERARSSKDTNELRTHISNAQEEIRLARNEFEEQNYHDIASVLSRTSVNLGTIQTAAIRGLPLSFELPSGLSDR